MKDPVYVGIRATPEYKIWKSMRNRCNNPKNQSYKYFGALGVKVCQRWDLFDNFYYDMGTCPKGMGIHRIDYNGNFEPSNCKWADRTERHNNRKDNIKITLPDEDNALTVKEAAKKLNILPATAYTRISVHNTIYKTDVRKGKKFSLGGTDVTVKEAAAKAELSISGIYYHLYKGRSMDQIIDLTS